jgi:hypothetical protein
MKTPIFTPATPVAQRDALIAINVEYLSWVAAEAETYFGITPQAAIGMTIAKYVPTVLDTICGDPPPLPQRAHSGPSARSHGLVSRYCWALVQTACAFLERQE